MIMVFIMILLGGKAIWETFLTVLNISHVRKCSSSPPEAVQQIMNPETFSRSVDYTLAKNRFELFSIWYGTLVLAVLLFSGFLPLFYQGFSGLIGQISLISESVFLVLIMVFVSFIGLPLEYYSRFRLEERFGFNRSTLRLWVTDKIKGLIIGLVIGIPLISLVIYLIFTLGSLWWIAAFVLVFAFQLSMMVLYPMLILPWFNKLSPLPQGDLRSRLMKLAQRTGFRAKTIQIMDGSKRSGHSNAFFTGFGRFRRIVLFDTLVDQLTPEELEAVLAHEIGHYRRGHIPRMLALSAAMTLAAFAVMAWLLKTPAFIQAFGFNPEQSGPAPALLLFALLAGLIIFWLSPLLSLLSRKHEYEADRFAAAHAGGSRPMIMALRRLSEKNLANLTPHPLYSGFYYSHPTLVEREKALAANPDT